MRDDVRGFRSAISEHLAVDNVCAEPQKAPAGDAKAGIQPERHPGQESPFQRRHPPDLPGPAQSRGTRKAIATLVGDALTGAKVGSDSDA